MKVQDINEFQLVEISSGSGITLGGSAGTITLEIPVSTTETWTPGLYYYDLVLLSGGGIATQLLTGQFQVTIGISPP